MRQKAYVVCGIGIMVVILLGYFFLPHAQQTTWYQPQPGTTWHWQLTGVINTSHDADMYDLDLETTPQAIIDELHVQGKKVICYFSAGTVEAWREDADQFPQHVIGKKLEAWPDEQWLDVKNYKIFVRIMEKRFDLAVQKKCDGMEADNIDAYQHNTGFIITEKEQLRYNRWLAEQAHKRNLAIGLKNDLEQVKDLVDVFDFAINERCFEYGECHLLLPFSKQNKAVFGVEYDLDREEFCDAAKKMRFSWLSMDEKLDGERRACS